MSPEYVPPSSLEHMWPCVCERDGGRERGKVGALFSSPRIPRDGQLDSALGTVLNAF